MIKLLDDGNVTAVAMADEIAKIIEVDADAIVDLRLLVNGIEMILYDTDPPGVVREPNREDGRTRDVILMLHGEFEFRVEVDEILSIERIGTQVTPAEEAEPQNEIEYTLLITGGAKVIVGLSFYGKMR